MLPEEVISLESLEYRFKIIEYIGHGSFGNVLKCFDKVKKEIVALKNINKLKNDNQYLNNINNEINILKNLDHPNINKFYGVFYIKNEKSYYIELEYCEQDLYGLLNNVKLSVDQAKYIMKQILEAVSYLEKKNIVHRDLKPGNILIKNGLEVKLADFGCAAELDLKNALTSHVCTLNYRPIELLLGKTDYGCEVDIWSIGVIFYHIITGNYLFDPSTSEELMVYNIIYKFGNRAIDESEELKFLPLSKRLNKRPYRTEEGNLFNRKEFDKFGKIKDMVMKMLSLNPSARPTASQLLETGIFDCERVDPEITQEVHQNSDIRILSLQSPVQLPLIRPSMPILYCY